MIIKITSIYTNLCIDRCLWFCTVLVFISQTSNMYVEFEVLKNKYVANLKLNYMYLYIGFKYLMLATCVVPIPCLHIIFMGYHK